MPRGRFYNSKATTNVQPESAGKKMQQKEKTDEKERNGVDKKGGVAHEVEQESISIQQGKQIKSAPQDEKTHGDQSSLVVGKPHFVQRKKGKKTIDQKVGVREDKKVEDQKKEGSNSQIKQESNKGAVHNDSKYNEDARAKGKEILALLLSGSKNDKVLTQENGDIEEALKGGNETTQKPLDDISQNILQQCDEMNPDQIVMRRKTMHIQSLEKKIFNIQSSLTMTSMKSSRSIILRKNRQMAIKLRNEWNEERQSLVAQITARDEALWKERSARFALEQEKNMIEYNYNYERQSLVAQIAARDEALTKVHQLEYELNQERDARFTLEQEKFELECRYNAIASHTDYDTTYFEGKIQHLENELTQLVRAKRDMKEEILTMNDKLDKFEQEKEEWDKKELEENEKRLSDAAQMREISVRCRLSRKGESMKDEFKEFEEKMRAYEENIESNVPAIEPKLATFEAIKLFADQKKICELSNDVAPLVVRILEDNGVDSVDAFMVLQFVRRSFIEHEDSSPTLSSHLLTPEAISVRIVELREYREWRVISPRITPVRASNRPSRLPQSSLQPNQPFNSTRNSANVGQSSSRHPNQFGSSSTPAHSSSSATAKESQRKQTKKKWNTSSKVREVNISERTCLICLDPIAERPAIQCEGLSCREPLHEDCITAQWKAGIQACPTCKGPMPDRSDFPLLSRK